MVHSADLGYNNSEPEGIFLMDRVKSGMTNGVQNLWCLRVREQIHRNVISCFAGIIQCKFFDV